MSSTFGGYLGGLSGVGGCITGGAIGGYDSLEHYGNSLFSNAKEHLIRSIAKEVAGILKISSSFADSADLKDIIEKFEKVVPNPRKGRKIKIDKKIHTDVCKKIAEAINKTYAMEIINVNDTAEHICQSISELLYSLFTGLHSEFITVAGDMTRIIRNLTVLQEYLDNAHKKLIDELKDNSPAEYGIIKDAYEALSREIHRQHAYLANLSGGVIGPVGSSLINLLEEHKAMPGLTDDLRSMTGSREFTDKLSSMMSGTSSVSHAAYLVDKALKQLGMSVSEYKNTKNIKDLRNKIYDKLVSKKPNSKELNKLMIASDILYRNDLSHEDIAKELSKKGGGADDDDQYAGGDDGMGFADMVSDSLYRDRDSVFKGRNHADKRSVGRTLHKQSVYREKLFSSLNQQIRDCYNVIITDLYKVGKKIGGEIKITDSLRLFIRQLGYFSGVQPDRKDLHKALSGYRKDVKSEYVKHDFIKSLETLKDASKSAAVDNNNIYFKNLDASISKLIKVIDDFNSTFTKALSEVHVDADRSYETDKKGGNINTIAGMESHLGGFNSMGGIDYLERQGGADSDDEQYNDATGGQDDAMGGSDDDFKYLVTMKKAIREVEYYYKIANIKTNLSVSAAQQDDYTKDYENILGEDCGMIIDAINSRYKMLTCDDASASKVMSKADYGAAGFTNLACQVKARIDATGTKDQWESYQFILEYMRTAKVEMIEAAQAIDLYLSKFTKNIQMNPDDIKDFVRLLDQVEIVSKWFTDKSGDNLVYVFESFASERAAGAVVARFELDKQPTSLSRHYYEFLDGDGESPGDWMKGVALDTRDKAKEFFIRIEKSIKSMRALENIISTFSKLSNKTSGDDIHTFMSPGLIFKAFMKYTVATSVALGKMTIHNAKDMRYSEWVNTQNGTDITTAFLKPARGKYLNVHYFDPLELDNGYLTTDDIFEMSVKSMISKVFTVVGSYSLYNRPAKDFANNRSLANSQLRQIMGGAAGIDIKIIPEAVELYIRLTLLGEWYRELFNFKSNAATTPDIIVSMIPSFDGIWADFVKIVFVDAVNVTDGGYTDTFSRDLITSINDIYTHYKPKYHSNTCSKILENFVAEVNLRYGLVKRQEINNYIKERDAGLNDESYNEDENVDYDILNSKDEFSRKAAPSDKFVSESYRFNGRSKISVKHFREQIREFRERVEMALDLKAGGPLSNKTQLGDTFDTLGLKYAGVDDLIRQTVKRIKESDSESKKYAIVRSTILGVERYSDVDYDAMLMFHETVINPLTILYTVYKMINDFNRFANSLHLDGANAVVVDECLQKLKALPGNDKYRDIVGAPATHAKRRYLYFAADDYTRYAAVAGVAGLAESNLLEDTINHLMYLTCDKNPMVELYFSGDGKSRYPILSFKNLEKYVVELLENVSDSMTKFRKIIPHEIISKYENSEQDEFTLSNAGASHEPSNPNVVSLFYLKEHFVDRLIKNKYGGGLSDANTALKSIWAFVAKDTLASTNRNLLAKLTYWDQELYARQDNGTQAAGGSLNTIKPLYTFKPRNIKTDNAWTKFPINKTGITRQSAIIDSRVPKSVSDELLKGVPDFTKINGDPVEIYRDAFGTNNYDGSFGFTGIYDYDDKKECYGIAYIQTRPFEAYGQEGHLGLVFKLNRLIYHYINMFTDNTSGKIYLPLLEKFANGPNAREIMKGGAIDDISRIGDNRITQLQFNAITAVFTDSFKLIRLKNSGAPSAAIRVQAGMLLGDLDAVGTNVGGNAIGVGVFFIVAGFAAAGAAADWVIINAAAAANNRSAQALRALVAAAANGGSTQAQINAAIDALNTFLPLLTKATVPFIGYAAFPMYETDSRSVLFATLARSIRNIVTDKKSGIASVSILMNAEANLLNISDYMKDLMTAYLPIFEKQLNILVSQADLIKSLLESTPLKVAGTVPGPATAGIDASGVPFSKVETDGVALTLRDPIVGIEADSKSHLITMLTSISSCAKSLHSCVKSVYKELADIPLYFETYQNSISDYKNRNNALPLMPLSQVSYLLNNQHSLLSTDDKPNIAERVKIDSHVYGGNVVGGATITEMVDILTVLNALALLGMYTNTFNLIEKARNDTIEAQGSVGTYDAARGAGNAANGGDAAFITATEALNVLKLSSAKALASATAADAALLADSAAVAAGGLRNRINIVQALTAATIVSATALDTAVDGIVTAVTAVGLGAGAGGCFAAIGVNVRDAPVTDSTAARAAAIDNQSSAVGFAGRQTYLSYANALIFMKNLKSLINKNTNISIPEYGIKYLITVYKKLALQNIDANNLLQFHTDLHAETFKMLAILVVGALSHTYNEDPAGAVNIQAQVRVACLRFNAAAAATAFHVSHANHVALFGAADADPPRSLFIAQAVCVMAWVNPGTQAVNSRAIATMHDIANGISVLVEPKINQAVGVPPAPAVGGRYQYYTCRGLIPHKDIGAGSEEFKFAYGTRGLLSDSNEPNIELAPGILSILDTYNAKVGGAASYDKRKIVDSFINSTYLLRFATDYIYHKTYLVNNDLDKLTNFYFVAAHNVDHKTKTSKKLNVLQHLSCQTARHSITDADYNDGLIKTNNEFFRNANNVLLLTENDNYKQSLYRMLRCILDTSLPEHLHNQDRAALRIYNILDANIVPINFHALQREVAFVNIFNYSYTFDHMIKQFIGVETRSRSLTQITLSETGSSLDIVEDVARGMPQIPKIGYYPEDALVRILIEPSGVRYMKDYVNNIWKLMAGNDSLSLNRPKYLSDQLWNKVLLNSLYSVQPQGNINNFMKDQDFNVHNANMARTMQYGNVARKDEFMPDPVLLSHIVEIIRNITLKICHDNTTNNTFGGDKTATYNQCENLYYAMIAVKCFKFIHTDITESEINEAIDKVIAAATAGAAKANARIGVISDARLNKLKADFDSVFVPTDVIGVFIIRIINLVNIGGAPDVNTLLGLMIQAAKYTNDILNLGYTEMTYMDNTVPTNANRHKTNNVKSVNLTDIPAVNLVAGAAPIASAPIASMVGYWHQTGFHRYQTSLVRYIEWFVHLQRVMRLLMRDQLTWMSDPIVHKSDALHESVTEYESNRKYRIEDFE